MSLLSTGKEIVKKNCAVDIMQFTTHCLGKSNLMDAISFVVGIKTRDLRGAKLKDLIYEVLTLHLSIN